MRRFPGNEFKFEVKSDESQKSPEALWNVFLSILMTDIFDLKNYLIDWECYHFKFFFSFFCQMTIMYHMLKSENRCCHCLLFWV